MAKDREGSINLFGAVQAKTEDGIVAHADGIAVEYDENGKPTKTLAQAIEDGSLGGNTGDSSNSIVIPVESLPTKLYADPTPIFSEDFVEKIYFNTKLSIQEVEDIIFEYADSFELYDESGNADFYISYGQDNKSVIRIRLYWNNEGNYEICMFDNAFPSFTYFWCNEEFAKNNIGNYNITKTGWQEFNNPLVVNTTMQASEMFISIPELVSSTSYGVLNPDVKLNAIYQLKAQKNAVPNTGYVKEVYFNKDLTEEKIIELISKLTPDGVYINDDGSADYYYSLLYANYLYESDYYTTSIEISRIVKNEKEYIEIFGYINKEYYTFWLNKEQAEELEAKEGWQEFDNPIVIDAEVVYEVGGNPIGEENNLIYELFSTTNDFSDNAQYKYYMLASKENEYVWGEFVPEFGESKSEFIEVKDVKELPSSTIDTSTVVPSSGYIEKVYFNTKLSVEELYNIFEALTYGEVPGTNYYPTVPVIANSDMSSALVAMKVTGGLEYDYLLNTMINGENTRILNLSKEKVEWFMSETLIRYESVAEFLAPQIGLAVQNDKLKQLISITPFEGPNTDIKLDKLYRTSIKGGGEWVGTVVPSSGQIEKVYFNTKLSVEEVNEILSGLKYVESVLDAPAYAIATTADMSQGLVIMSGIHGDGSTMYVIVTGDGKYIYQYLPGDPYTPLGFQYSEVDLNIDNMLSVLAPQVGMTIQNDKLSKLVSTTPFTKINEEIVGYKYNQFVDGEWKELGSGGDSGISKEEVNTLISEYMSTNYDNGDTEEF